MRNIIKGFNKKKRRTNNTQEHSNPAPYERHGTTSDKIGVIVNSILAVLTLAAIAISYQSNQTAIKSLEYAKSKDSSDNAAQMVRDSIGNVDRSLNRKYVDSTLYISSQSVDASKKSTDIAAQALNETKKSYEFSREAAIKELRAYMVGESCEISKIAADSFYIINATFKNTGKTNASNFRNLSATVVGISEESENVRMLVKQIKNRYIPNPPISSIGAGQITSTTLKSNRMTALDYELIKSGYYKIYYACTLIYNDIFGVERSTNIFIWYDINRKAFAVCNSFNEAN